MRATTSRRPPRRGGTRVTHRTRGREREGTETVRAARCDRLKTDGRELEDFVGNRAGVRRGEGGGGGGGARRRFRRARRRGVSRRRPLERSIDIFVPETKAKQILARIARSSHHLCGLTRGVSGEIDAQDADAANLKTVRRRIEEVLVKIKRVHVVGGKRVLVRESRARKNPSTLLARMWLFREHPTEPSGIFLNLHDAQDVRLASGGVRGDDLRRAR